MFKKLIPLLLSTALYAVPSQQPYFPQNISFNSVEYSPYETYVFAKDVPSAKNIMNEYLLTYNIQKEISSTIKIVNYISNGNRGMIVKFILVNKA